MDTAVVYCLCFFFLLPSSGTRRYKYSTVQAGGEKTKWRPR